MLNLCAKSYYYIWALRPIWPMLTEDIAKSVACSLVNALLDYASSVLFGVTTKNIMKLQLVQNTQAPIVTDLQHLDRITPTLNYIGYR